MVGLVVVVAKRVLVRVGMSGESRVRVEESVALWWEACGAEAVTALGVA